MLPQDSELRLKVIHTVDRELLLENASSVLCCFSGGIDSTVLLHVLMSLSERYSFSLSAVHVNHGIRGAEAKRDEDFCLDTCKKLGVPLYVRHVDVPTYAKEKKISTELAARELRYAAFESVMSEIHADVAATAHNANDNAETLLFNIIRGTTTSGICSIPYRRGRYIRPLLNVSRDEIVEYAKMFGIEFVIDSTNGNDIYTRNFIRNNIIPLCEKLNPSFLSAVTRLTDSAKADEATLFALNADASRIALRFLRDNGVEEINNETVRKISNAMLSGGSRKFMLSGGRQLVVENGLLKLYQGEERRFDYAASSIQKGSNVFFDGAVTIDVQPSSENFREIYKSFTTVGHVSDIIFNNVTVRNRLPGDTVTVCGVRKSVKKELINRKIPVDMRNVLPVICIGDRIAFVPFVGVDDAFSPEEDKSSLKISVTFNIDQYNIFHMEAGAK